VIVRNRPGARLTVVGDGAPDELRRLAGPHLEFTSLVPDTRPYLDSAAAVVVPMRMGSGTRLKVLEGLAMQRPLISTSLGCEGIAAVDGVHLLVADDPATFAGSVLRVMNDPALSKKLGSNGRDLAESGYSWPVVLRHWETFMRAQRSGASRHASAQPFLNRS
jgi:glycosyltransferase involved in cell wall biosynthesis